MNSHEISDPQKQAIYKCSLTRVTQQFTSARNGLAFIWIFWLPQTVIWRDLWLSTNSCHIFLAEQKRRDYIETLQCCLNSLKLDFLDQLKIRSNVNQVNMGFLVWGLKHLRSEVTFQRVWPGHVLLWHSCCFCAHLVGITSTLHQWQLAAIKQGKYKKDLATALASRYYVISGYQQASLKKKRALCCSRCNVQGDCRNFSQRTAIPRTDSPKDHTNT